MNIAITPANLVLEMTIFNQVLLAFLILIMVALVYPMLMYCYKNVKAITHPIMFPYKHVLITGCGSGLGRALVNEIHLKGAYITMIGRDKEKL